MKKESELIGNVKFNYHADGTLHNIELKEIQENEELEQIKTIIKNAETWKTNENKIIKEELINIWQEWIDICLKDSRKAWYKGAIIEAAFICMQKLSEGLPVEEVYTLIDLTNTQNPPIYYNIQLNEWLNKTITKIIRIYHPNGKEFYDYRNTIVESSKVKKLEQ